MKRENRILIGIAVLLIAVCLVDVRRIAAEKEAPPEEQVSREDSVVIENLHVLSGADIWTAFYETAQAGDPAQVRLVKSHVGAGEESTHILDLVFDGETYALAGSEHTYRYLLCFPDVAARSGANFSSATYYILANDDTVTLEEIAWYEVSSFVEEPLDVCGVYTEYIWKDET